ncbi:aryl-alcohol dehydrogenase-like predicted oxidoreductase [Pullulanibacillus pueri]|uniref:Oxidoreductase n=1 Tax=Pullulanibacillus pueri TaxID=1437324 RepID=A0A8J2ZRK4_9BACL|nr:aldo/keto reductase [Pullulanibacillus pueri]MBM7679850.1 aryl-alcohol dehydrogenase-like predicted oxidoreductase [Pullulanibacillus pueri]GGH73148.1 oxidoreductase [Pullulanibacillus pueri]
MDKRRIGQGGPFVSQIGLGCMGMSDFYGETDRTESIATIHEALEKGITLFDTGDFYGVGHNELLLGEALKGKRENAFISVKFGAMRSPDKSFIGYDARPEAVKNFLAYTLQRLGVDYIDLYQPARVDPNVPIEETVGAISDMVKAGYVKHIGLSEAGADTVRRAHAVHPISWLQIEYSLFSRNLETYILPTLRELGIALNPYGVLSRGLLSGKWSKERTTNQKDFRSHSPRFSGANLDKNLQLVENLRKIADEKHTTVAKLAIAWVLAQGEDIIPLIGARKRSQLEDATDALNIQLSQEDLERIEQAIPASEVAGDRYNESEMKMLDSEK